MNEARQLFLKYDGSYFHMDRDGELDKYREYNIDVDTEKQWLCEYQLELIEQLQLGKSSDVIFSRVCSLMRAAKCDDNVEHFINATNKNLNSEDSFVRLRIAEELQDLIEFFSTNSNGSSKKILKYKSMAVEILQNITFEPIVISEETRQNVAFEDTLKDENLRKRAEARLKRFNKD